MFSSFSGLPKFKQLVIAIGFAPTDIRFLKLSQTTCFPPVKGWAHPLTGGKQVVCESFRNLISVGAKPIAITNCLNFGSPENEENMGEFVECVQGIGEASEYLKFPVVSGNVSFYNQTKDQGIKLYTLVFCLVVERYISRNYWEF